MAIFTFLTVTGFFSGLTNFAGDALTRVQSWFLSADWSRPGWDLLLILFFIIAVFLYGISLGRGRLIIILTSIYMALAVVSSAPIIGTASPAGIPGSHLFIFKLSAFLVLGVLLFFLLSRSSLMITFGGSTIVKWWQVLIFSILQVGLLISIILSFLPMDAVNHLAPLARHLFATETVRFVWIVAPIVGLILT